MAEEEKIRITKQKTESANGNLRYAKRYSNNTFEYSGFASQAEAEKFLDEKKNVETIKENTPYKESLPISQQVNSGANQPSENIKTQPTPQTDSIINVVRDYDWTYSKNKIKKWTEIPYIYIEEFKLAGNSYLSSLMSSALLFPDVLESSVGKNSVAKNFYDKLKKDFSNNEFGKFMGAIGDNANKVTEKLQKGVNDFANRISDQVKGIDTTAEAWKGKTGGDDDLAKKYAYLYIREKTGRNYKFPYFEKGYINISNEFSDTYSNANELQKMVGGFSELIEKTAGMLNVASITEPGMFIQRPKFFNFANSEYSIDVNFYLFNTISPNAYIKNLDLITKLLIQNTPHRHNRILVDPPAIYELKVPGRGFYPYTFISKFEVNHEGTKRILQLNGKDTIVPDAFRVSMTFKSLTNEVNNFMIPEMGTAGIDVAKRYNALNNPKKETSKPAATPSSNPKMDMTASPIGGSGTVTTGTRNTVPTQAGFLPSVKTI
jgi:hypothetical protein